MEDRIVELELRLTHQEAAVDELTRSVLHQEQALAALTAELELVKSYLRELAPAAVAPESEEGPPPHY